MVLLVVRVAGKAITKLVQGEVLGGVLPNKTLRVSKVERNCESVRLFLLPQNHQQANRNSYITEVVQ